MPASVIIVGGSLSGLLHGLYFKHQGVDVTILEQDPRDERSSHNAGIMVGPNLQAMLRQHDRTGQSFSVGATGLRWSLRGWQDVWRPATAARHYTNWAYLYRLLRANFDGHVSQACPVPPVGKEGDGKARYLRGRRVTGLHYADNDAGGAVELEAVNEAGHCESYCAELVIGADGSRSTVRKLLNAPQTLPLTYAGHFCWRGSVPVRDVSKETANFFMGNTCFDLLGNKSYILCYVIPTDDGDFGHDDALLNWLLYQDLDEDSAEEAVIFTDKHGRRAQRTVGRGLLAPEVWETRRAQLTARMVAPFAELVNKSPTPFVTKISEALGSQANFYDGHVILVGDALASYRPNLGRATDQAAAHCLALAEALQHGERTGDGSQVAAMAAWNRRVCRENENVLLLSRLMSEATRGTWWSLLKAAVGYVGFLWRKE